MDWIEEPLDERFDEIARRLDAQYGPRTLTPNGDPVSELVRTILSQGTNDRNSGRAYDSLVDAFPTWEEVIDAPTVDVERAIAMGGLSKQKSPRIQAALRSMHDDKLTVNSLTVRPLNDAMKALTDLDGVGPKTAACVMLFALGRPVMPADTHVGRVMTRLGIVPDRTSTVTKQAILTNLVGENAQTMFAVHVEMIEHGRNVCVARTPKCSICRLQDVCAWYTQHDLESD